MSGRAEVNGMVMQPAKKWATSEEAALEAGYETEYPALVRQAPEWGLVHVGDEIAQLEQEPQQGQEIEVSPVDLPQRGEKPVQSRRFVIHFPASFLAVRVDTPQFCLYVAI